ncbi:MAG: glycosyltransferase family 39 protein [Bacilli bacterium]|nr:glycosyltransferase family 39 protein [Bacilli bacterium]
MKEFFIKNKKVLIDIAVLCAVFLFVFISYFVFKPLYFRSETIKGTTDGIIPRIFIYTCIIIFLITGLILKVKNKLSFETLLFLIFILGVLMQLNYMLITPFNYRQHDVFSYNNAGHQGYAWTLYATGKMPTQVDENGYLDYQFYHPPFNAFMQATFMHICKPFMQLYNAMTGSTYYDVNSMDSLFQTSEILSCFYMNIATFFAIKIANKLKVKDVFKVFGSLFIALFPALMILAGQENNDPLCIMNCFIVIYFTICWWENHSYFNAIMIGLFGGLAMFAKLSGALILVPAIVAFAFVLIQNIIKKDSDFKHQLIQGAIIGLIVAPLGLWFHIYAKIKFNQPFGFVFANLNSKLYVGDYNFFERFINIFDFGDLTTSIWGNTFVNYNLPNFLIKSALFGEYSFMFADSLAILSLIFNYLFVYLSLILIIAYFINSKKEHLEIKIIGGVIILSQLLAQLYFNIKMPYGCTMDFRYIVPIILGFMILNTLAFDKFHEEKSWRKYYSYSVMIIQGLLLVSITLFYLTAI